MNPIRSHNLIDLVITLLRFPLAIISMAIVTCTHLLHFAAETVLAALWLPIAVALQSRNDIKQSWIAQYPNIIRHGYGYHHQSLPSLYRDGLLLCVVITPLKLCFWALFPSKGIVPCIRTLITWVQRDA